MDGAQSWKIGEALMKRSKIVVEVPILLFYLLWIRDRQLNAQLNVWPMADGQLTALGEESDRIGENCLHRLYFHLYSNN
jgi:hypothetical protein